MAIIDVNAEIGTTLLWGAPFTDAHLARSMRKYSVERSIASSTIGNSCDFALGNVQVAAACQVNKAIARCAVVNVNYPEQSQEDMRTYLGRDDFAAVRLISGARNRQVTLMECEEILNAHRRFVKPVFLRARDKDSLVAADEIAKAFPAMKFVLLEMGGDDWRMAAVLAERTLNLVLEVSGSFSPDKIKFAVEHIGSHRMVYGSNLPYVDPSAVIGMIQDADISDPDKRNIFENSARRLFGWTGSAGQS